MTALAGPVHAAALVVLAAGVAKAASPTAAATAMRTVGLPGSRASVRALAAAEVAIALAVLAGAGRPAAAALAGLHAGFAAVAAALRRRSATCGCFGDAAPVTGTHVAANLIAAAVAAAGAVVAVPSLAAAMGDTPAAGIPYAVLVALLAAGEVACLTVLAETQAAAARLRAGAGPRR